MGLKKIIPGSLFYFFRPAYHFLLALGAALFYRFPSRKLIVIGITGTKGKTTVVELAHKILEETGAGVASLSSLRFKIRKSEVVNSKKMTMPGRCFLQKFLRDAVRQKCKYALLEVTSEGIKQFRHRFIDFSAALMTNVAPEHLEAHKSFERYLRAKLDLFWRLPKGGEAIINRDDPEKIRFVGSTAARKIFYGRDGIELGGSFFPVQEINIDKAGVRFEVNGYTISSKLPGEFNFYNILAAMALGASQHVSFEKMASAVAGVSEISGRMEYVQREPFAVVVDYAHTPDSLRKVYAFLKESSPRLICVLGAAGGGRDKWKRPEFGKIAAQFCEEVILTNEDPYDEPPQSIIEDIERGFSQAANGKSQIVKKILDRREAVREALKSAKPGDTVIITGKGAEPWIMGPHSQKIPWDDRKIIREELKI